MSKPSEQVGKREPRFEEAIAQIETLIERIESGETGLEESIAHYERGMKLLSRCQAVLQTLEKKVVELTADANGKLGVASEAEVEAEVELEAVPEEEGDAGSQPAPTPPPARGKPAKIKPAPRDDAKPDSRPDIAEEDIPF